MSEFQRFVTYINLYEKNNKIRSLGFAKIEKRGEQCKIEIHMRGTGYTGISCPVYLFVRKNEKMEGIFLGKIQIMNGVGDCRFLTDSSNIGQSGYTLGQIGGFLIFVNDKIMFASQWDDREILREQFFVPAEEQKDEDMDGKPKADEKDVKTKEAGTKETGTKEAGTKEANEREIKARKTGVEEAAEETAAKRVDTKEGSKKEGNSSGDVEEDKTFSSIEAAGNSAIEATEAAAQRVRQMPMGRGMQQRSGQMPVGTSFQRGEQAMKRVVPSQRESRLPMEETEQSWEQKWQFILENYPVLTPFEGEEEIMCIRMELKDLRLLPKRYWYLGNNSFLLHGFFNYRYLLLGSMKKGEKKEWFLGVPGVFQSQEKVMAAIFGFPEYKSEKISVQKTGSFGYWYRFMDL